MQLPAGSLTLVFILFVGPYLIVATKRALVGKIEGHDIFEASGFEIIPFTKSTYHLSESQVRPHYWPRGGVEMYGGY